MPTKEEKEKRALAQRRHQVEAPQLTGEGLLDQQKRNCLAVLNHRANMKTQGSKEEKAKRALTQRRHQAKHQD